MTLFDGVPLTEEEVRARDVCKCSHSYGKHDALGSCSECACGGSDVAASDAAKAAGQKAMREAGDA